MNKGCLNKTDKKGTPIEERRELCLIVVSLFHLSAEESYKRKRKIKSKSSRPEMSVEDQYKISRVINF